ncbi:MAG: acyl-CoA/acyl-ACP dehydrogenase [Aeromicrobium sp.]|nr:acyl-CoA/acyl-ACP dehydrogenase [Aeromicrobium sp.]
MRDELRETTRQLFAKELPLESAVERSGLDTGPAADWGPLWRRVTTDLGVTAVAVDEAHGGLGLGLAEMAVVLEEAGRALSPLPLVDAAVAAVVLRDVAPDLLPAVAAGSAIVAVDLGVRDVGDVGPTTAVSFLTEAVVAGAGATHLLTWPSPRQAVVVAVDAPGVTRRSTTSIDPTRDTVRLELDRVLPDVVVPDPVGLLRRTALAVRRLGSALDSVGAARVCLDVAVEHAGSREQFGKPIGSFQAVKHACAEMLLALETAVSTADAAARTAVDPAAPDFAVAAALAHDYCSRSFELVAAQTIQVLGGIGFTWEHPAHLFLKRARVNGLLGGAGVDVRRELAAHLGLGPVDTGSSAAFPALST